MKNEIFFSIDVENELVEGVCHFPEIENELNEIGIVFLHGWAGYRTGPHDMFVKLARRLSKKGLFCARFDFRGKGYSSGNKKNTTYKSMLLDLNNVIKEIKEKTNIKKVILLGICSGARLGLSYIKNGKYPVNGLIELSSAFLKETESVNIELKKSQSILSTYFFKLFNVLTWKKILQLEVNYYSIFKSIYIPLKIAYNKIYMKKKEKNTPMNISNSSHKFSGEVLCIHGENDPETKESVFQVQNYLNANSISNQLYLIKGANHSFYSLSWEDEIFKKIENWLTEYYGF